MPWLSFGVLMMEGILNRGELESFIVENFGADADHPWRKYPDYAVFRHDDTRKWFALIMDVPRNRLGLQGTGTLDVVNVKCDPFLIGSLRGEPGFFPAYHMSKDAWVTVALDGSVADDTIAMLLDMSYRLTVSKARGHRKREKA